MNPRYERGGFLFQGQVRVLYYNIQIFFASYFIQCLWFKKKCCCKENTKQGIKNFKIHIIRNHFKLFRKAVHMSGNITVPGGY